LNSKIQLIQMGLKVGGISRKVFSDYWWYDLAQLAWYDFAKRYRSKVKGGKNVKTGARLTAHGSRRMEKDEGERLKRF